MDALIIHLIESRKCKKCMLHTCNMHFQDIKINKIKEGYPKGYPSLVGEAGLEPARPQ